MLLPYRFFYFIYKKGNAIRVAIRVMIDSDELTFVECMNGRKKEKRLKNDDELPSMGCMENALHFGWRIM